MNNKRWEEVKKEMEIYMLFDKDNVDKSTGEVIIDFEDPYGDYSIAGKVIYNKDTDEDEIIIDDNAIMYINK